MHNTESQHVQYNLCERAERLGWPPSRIKVIIRLTVELLNRLLTRNHIQALAQVHKLKLMCQVLNLESFSKLMCQVLNLESFSILLTIE